MNQLGSTEVANHFINKAFESGSEITPMKVLKLVYIAHGWHLGLTDEALIDEPAQAWQYGPVVPTLYHCLKDYGKGPVDRLIFNLNSHQADENQKVLLDKIWDIYKDFDGLQLSTLTHQEGTPWYITYHFNGGRHNNSTPIPNSLIREHYKQKLAQNKQFINDGH